MGAYTERLVRILKDRDDIFGILLFHFQYLFWSVCRSTAKTFSSDVKMSFKATHSLIILQTTKSKHYDANRTIVQMM
jgi:hypothetical protein